MTDTLSIIRIVLSTIVDGPGMRTAIYGAGCMNRCQGCHNPDSRELSAGRPMRIEDIALQVSGQPGGVTFSGGDPFFQAEGFTHLARTIKRQTGKNIWCYTGLTFEQVLEVPAWKAMLQYIDVLVDGPFVQELKSPELMFRGSSNQRLIDVPRTMALGRIAEVDYNPLPEICRRDL